MAKKKKAGAGNQTEIPGTEEKQTEQQQLATVLLNRLVAKGAANDAVHEAENALKLSMREANVPEVKVKDDSDNVHIFLLDSQTHVRHRTRKSKSDKGGTAVSDG